ncbi:hypothetical protein JTE90_022941 [Oedothorax gibbosus]|uniref:Proline dehydrogenase n=1 Tax=Oedothorax gibbosus TaxID=931172 RepID=A0AAV6U749_9ARAC|nr:hypothetical protein JTE90_022941 [Oedothorax gibbosus]
MLKEVDFDDPSASFRDKSTWEVGRALAILRLCGIDTFADNGEKLLCWVPESLLRPTIYAQFVGGDLEAELRLAMRRAKEAGLKAMLAATMEEEIESHVAGPIDDQVLDRNSHRIARCVRLAAEEEGMGALVQMKLSGLVRPKLLVSLGHAYSTKGLPVVEDIARQITDGKTSQMATLKSILTEEDKDALLRAVGRLKMIGKEAEERGVSVLVDAESTPLNDGLSALTLAGAAAFNSARPVIWNTYQCYLKDAERRVRHEYQLLKEGVGVCFGAKLVRGAYMMQERARTPDPVCRDYKATTDNYHRILSSLLEKCSPKCHMIAATHNEESIQLVVKKLRGTDRSHVSFGQLYGMADHISGPLARAGFSVHKSIPCGSVREVLPYLARRATENRALMEGAQRERALLATEMFSRARRALLRR